jgi:rhamnosyl/mannosyltransferase
VTGLVVPPADSNALKNALQQLWDNPALAAQYGMAARQRYLNLFTAQNMGRAYTEIYKNLL